MIMVAKVSQATRADLHLDHLLVVEIAEVVLELHGPGAATHGIVAL